MDLTISDHMRRSYDKSLTRVRAVLAQSQLEPNNIQMGIAVAMLMQKLSRVFLTMPSG